MDPNLLDKIIHERVRLAIMSALAAREKLSFSELKEMLQVTDGNLGVNAQVLEKHGLIVSNKTFVDRKPRTTYALTEKGRAGFNQYVENMEKMIHQKPESKE